MSETLLQTIVEKLGILEALLKQVLAGKDETNQNQLTVQLHALNADIKKIVKQFLLNQEKINELKLKMETLEKKLQEPLRNTIEHKHHLHKGYGLLLFYFLFQHFSSVHG
jgi:septal ring factor EnvC (AmiA/AmiB activator)